ncbi:phosphatidylethanolamine-binding protein [Kockovaella imperatae]|uniref:Phosphatidylethanolamine-binding protein n=1 Tax=Kockovaella imperatae TaxID=4999 RepID=A0A1Y1USF1_9TREE|nr:phosphatidylethanolamine-binding protein [Kockovaella imperatae]ORX40454.1 phosphatidylethanolamine-binding protein [Kockovaella imperatae]
MNALASSSRCVRQNARSYATKANKVAQTSVSKPSLVAHEAAVAFLAQHQSRCMDKLKPLQSVSDPSPAQRRAIEAYEISAQVNDPDVRAEFKRTEGAGSMDRPVMRHLAERKWKLEGGLDLIMRRMYENKVVPDLLPDLAPTNPLTIHLPRNESFEPGLTLLASTFQSPPRLTFTLFNPPSDTVGKYTLIVLDADHPETITHSYSQRLHYLKTNIPLRVTDDQTDLFTSAGDELLPWEPLAPPRGSSRHRYTFVLLRQPASVAIQAPPRQGFNLRRYLADRGVSPASVVGLNLVKSEWTASTQTYIDQIWRKFRGKPAPIYSNRIATNPERYLVPPRSAEKRAWAIRKRAWDEAMEKFAQVGLDKQVASEAEGALGSPNVAL